MVNVCASSHTRIDRLLLDSASCKTTRLLTGRRPGWRKVEVPALAAAALQHGLWPGALGQQPELPAVAALQQRAAQAAGSQSTTFYSDSRGRVLFALTNFGVSIITHYSCRLPDVGPGEGGARCQHSRHTGVAVRGERRGQGRVGGRGGKGFEENEEAGGEYETFLFPHHHRPPGAQTAFINPRLEQHLL